MTTFAPWATFQYLESDLAKISRALKSIDSNLQKLVVGHDATQLVRIVFDLVPGWC